MLSTLSPTRTIAWILIGATVTLGGCQANSFQTVVPLESPPSTSLGSNTGDRVSSIFQDDLTDTTVEDAAIALAIFNLPNGTLNPSEVAEAANDLLRNTTSISASSLSADLLDTDCIDYVETNTTVELNDIAVVLAGAVPGESSPTAANLASAANNLLTPFGSLEESNIAFIPGQSQPCAGITSDPFDIQLRFFDSSLSPSQVAIVQSAANRWMQAIVSGLPPEEPVSIPADFCLEGTPPFNGNIDDLVIDVFAVNIDGLNLTLAEAGPCRTRESSGLPFYGVLRFDSNDLEQLERDGELFDIALHEMAHVLGFGTIWDRVPFDFLDTNSSGVGLSDPRFIGRNAIQAYEALGESGTVPVENIGGTGSVGSHWRESTFRSELMTSRVTTGNNPLSRLTLAQFADLGYQVDTSVADEYSLPFSFGFNRATSERSPDIPRFERLIYPKQSVGERE